MLGRALVLQDRVEGHREETPEEGHEEQVDQQSPASRRREKGTDAEQHSCRYATAAGAMKVNSAEPHRDSGERDVPGADLAAEQPFCEQRPESDAHREQRE